MIRLLSDDIEDLIDQYIEQVERAAEAWQALHVATEAKINIILSLLEHGISQTEVSRKLGISRQRINQLINKNLDHKNE